MNVRSGIDAVYIPRIKKILEKNPDAFIRKCYTSREKEYAMSFTGPGRSAEILAGRFAAKEAVSKALGTGILTGGIALTDIEILTDLTGAPYVELSGAALNRAGKIKMTSCSVSITHERDYAAAVCVLLTDEEN